MTDTARLHEPGDDLELLHQCKLQLSHAGPTVTLDTGVFTKLIRLAGKGVSYGNPYLQQQSPTTDLRIPPDTSTKCTAGFYDEINKAP